ncbi:5792_t:CDS:2 [Entrophospora sp. SA101]|nr:4722_t:CDS:2 [Entrophospora sp. SA101]CAJ0885144.1 5792_t:CDS:2 [Entrophospora sp. SA101]
MGGVTKVWLFSTTEVSWHTKLMTLQTFEVAFERVFSLHDLGVVKMNRERPLNLNQINDDIEKLKCKLNRDTTHFYQHLYSSIDKISVKELSWKDPLAVQLLVIIQILRRNYPKA